MAHRQSRWYACDSTDVDEWNNRIERGLVHITNVTRLEIGYSGRSGNPLGGTSITAVCSHARRILNSRSKIAS
jgi:hypothetical protein